MPFVLGRGRRAMEDAVAQFRAAPAAGAHAAKGGPARTLLLLIKQGANGLNLTGAPARQGPRRHCLPVSRSVPACCRRVLLMRVKKAPRAERA